MSVERILGTGEGPIGSFFRAREVLCARGEEERHTGPSIRSPALGLKVERSCSCTGGSTSALEGVERKERCAAIVGKRTLLR